MDIDLSRYRMVYFEEVQENLDTLKYMLRAGADNPDEESLSNARRAAHSIKGASATFGFVELVEIAEELEAFLDKSKMNRGLLSQEALMCTRDACDVLQAGIEARRESRQMEESQTSGVCLRLRSMLDTPSG